MTCFCPLIFLNISPIRTECFAAFTITSRRTVWGRSQSQGLEYILENGSYYELIRDHIAYYTFPSLRYLLERNGFTVLEQQIVNRDTLSVIVKKSKPLALHILPESYRTVRNDIDRFLKALEEEKPGSRLAMWGASHQGFTIAATTALKERIAYIVDSAPFKQGKYAPASHLPIVPPDKLLQDPVDAVLIVAPGYTEEIFNVITNKMQLSASVYAIRTNRVEKLTS